MGHAIVVPRGIASSLGHAFDAKGRLIDGGTHKHREGRKYHRWIKRPRRIRSHPAFPRIQHYSGTVAAVTSSTQRFYFHWLLEVLPRLGMLSALPEKIDLIYIERRHRFQRETLDMLSLGEDQIINSADVAAVSAERLVIPCHQVMNGREIPSWATRYVREQFLPRSEPGLSPGARRIYISRRSCVHRRLVNEREIAGRLASCGFVEVEAEKLSFREQVRLFRGAEAVAAPHGSGLANIVFCPPGAKVVELFPAANIDLYYRLSTSLGLSYFYVKSRSGDPARLTLDDYRIAWKDLKATLQKAGIARPH